MNLISLFLFLFLALPLTAQVAAVSVQNTNDSGAGSLREAIADASSGVPLTISFDSSLAGETIILTAEIVISNDVTIQGLSETDGITISGGGNSRIFSVTQDADVTLLNLTLRDGMVPAGGVYPANGGGAILNRGSLEIGGCLLRNNFGGNFGGAITNFGVERLENEENRTVMSLSNCTFTENTVVGASSQGGAVHNFSSMPNQAFCFIGTCTIVGNTAAIGGGVYNESQMFLTASIVANNTATTDPDLSLFPANATTNELEQSVNIFSTNSTTVSGGLEAFGSLIADPQLSPLGDFGGPTHVFHPLRASPAIDPVGGGTGFEDSTDQRGFTGQVGLTADIGAVEAGPLFVAGNQSEGEGSLQEVITTAAEIPGARISFSSADTITLTTGELSIPSTAEGLFIDASNISGGKTISGNDQSRVFSIPEDATVAMHSLAIVDGQTDTDGGGILNSGVCTVISSILSGNTAGSGIAASRGGGIANFGICTVISSTFSGNSANPDSGNTGIGGGGIYNESGTCSVISSVLSNNNSSGSGGGIYNESGTCSMASSTLSGNSADSGNGGGILNNGALSIISSTLSGNSANAGGGIESFGNLRLSFSIVAGNTADRRDPDIFSSSGLTGSNNITNSPPQLAPLGDYGGPTQTMHPLAGSPAILTGGAVTRTDQRGFALTGPPTIGAVQLGEVTEVNDEDDLRTALTGSASSEGQVIRITSNITLGAEGQLVVPGTANGLFLEAPGLTIDANGTEGDLRRVMLISPGATAALHGLTLTGGFVSGSGGAIFNNQATLSLSACTLSDNSASNQGGGIFSDGRNNGSATLNLSSCTLSDNSASNEGGGIFSDGRDNGSATLSLSACTISGNSADRGGGIYSDGASSGSATLNLNACTLTGNCSSIFGGGIFNIADSSGSATLSLSACTLSGNSAGAANGGAIYNEGSSDGSAPLSLSACTISGNSAGGFGGGIASSAFQSAGTLSLNDTILAGNTAPIGPDLRVQESDTEFTQSGNNLFDVTSPIDPMLAPLGDYGGATQTMPPLPGSPAIDAAGNSTATADQRGFPIVGIPDIGAVEFQGDEEELNLAFFEDLDGDGTPVGVELAIGSAPRTSDPSHPNKLQPQGFDGTSFQLQFGYADTTIPLTLTRSIDLINFEEIAVSGDDFNTGPDLIFIEDSDPPEAKAFYRLEATRPE